LEYVGNPENGTCGILISTKKQSKKEFRIQ
jgi:hypothetical protein